MANGDVETARALGVLDGRVEGLARLLGERYDGLAKSVDGLRKDVTERLSQVQVNEAAIRMLANRTAALEAAEQARIEQRLNKAEEAARKAQEAAEAKAEATWGAFRVGKGVYWLIGAAAAVAGLMKALQIW